MVREITGYEIFKNMINKWGSFFMVEHMKIDAK